MLRKLFRQRPLVCVALLVLALALSAALHGATATDWCAGGVCQEWVARYDGPGGDIDWATDLAVDASGNVYVTGWSAALSLGPIDYATVKYAPDGSQEWVARYDGPASDYDYASLLAVDGSGDVYVTGASSGSVTSYDYATIKYRPDGSEEWVARYDGPLSGKDWARALAVDGWGSVYVTGASEGFWTGYDYATVKYGPDGTEQWVARYDGPAEGEDEAKALAVDGSGNVYVTGWSTGSGTEYDYATIKYGPDGSEQWVARYDGPGSDRDQPYGLAVDGSGSVYVSGRSAGSGGTDDYATIKYGPDGSEQWLVRYDGPASGSDWAWAITVDGSRNVYVTGQSPGLGTSYDYATIKYGPDGSQQWLARYDAPASSGDEARDLTLDASGNVYVTGASYAPATGFDYATLKYGPDGSEEWVARYDGPARYDDWPHAIAVDGSSNVYITGSSSGSGMNYDYATIKYTAAPFTPTPTPPPVGGIVEIWPQDRDPQAEMAPDSSPSWHIALAAVAAGALALAAGAWYARTRLLR